MSTTKIKIVNVHRYSQILVVHLKAFQGISREIKTAVLSIMGIKRTERTIKSTVTC